MKTRLTSLILFLALSLAAGAVSPSGTQLVIIGGGPNPSANQVAIENNVLYLQRILQPGVQQTIFFADGDRNARTVAYRKDGVMLTTAERLAPWLLPGNFDPEDKLIGYRQPTLRQIDGGTRRKSLDDLFGRFGADRSMSSDPLFLYFTGHGSPGKNADLENNRFNAWGEDLTVRDVAGYLQQVPTSRPITLVMVQCYSGGFGNLLFEGGDPARPFVDRDIAGFFATVKERPAAGCTPAVNEESYRDFSTYFFAALAGRDRVGQVSTGADYDKSGAVTLYEAYIFAVINDESIDVPVCTSDVLLRSMSRTPEATIFAEPYANVLKWANPAQRAALEALSSRLNLTGENRGDIAYAFLRSGGGDGRRNPAAAARRAMARATASVRRDLISRYPDLESTDADRSLQARREAIQRIERMLAASELDEVIAAEKSFQKAEEDSEAAQITEAANLRFARLFKSVFLTHEVRESGNEENKKRLATLIRSESRTTTLFRTNRQASRP